MQIRTVDNKELVDDIRARLKANDFDVTELNSDLIKRLVNGKVNVNLELNTKDSSSELSSAPVYTGISNDYLKKEV